jgi:hypothetical protein
MSEEISEGDYYEMASSKIPNFRSVTLLPEGIHLD